MSHSSGATTAGIDSDVDADVIRVHRDGERCGQAPLRRHGNWPASDAKHRFFAEFIEEKLFFDRFTLVRDQRGELTK